MAENDRLTRKRNFLPTPKAGKRFLVQCREQALAMTSVNDITLLLMSDGKEWGKYISDKLTSFPKVSHATLILDDQLYENPPELTIACRESTVVVLLATPELLCYLRDKACWFSTTLQEVPDTSSIVVLPLVTRQEVDDITNDNYVTAHWNFCELGETVEAVQQAIAEVLDTVERCQKAKLRGEAVKEEETEVVEKETKEKGKEKVKPKPHSRGHPVELFPSTVYECNVRVAMVFKEEVKGEVTLKLEQTDHQISAQRVNSTVYTFTVPTVEPGRHSVLVFVDNTRLQHCRPQLHVQGADMAFFTSPHYLAQALGIHNLKELDLKLKDNFTSSLPADGSLDLVFKNLPSPDTAEQQKNADTKYPTLLHYSAAHGLYEFSAALMECPYSSRAFSIRNCDGLDPAQLAEYGGFADLAKYLIDFEDLRKANDICGDYIAMYGPEPDEVDSDDDYVDPDETNKLAYRDRISSDPCPSGTYVTPPIQPLRTEVHATGEDDVTDLPAGRRNRPPVPPPRSKPNAVPQRSASERQTSSKPPAVQRRVENKASTLPATSRLDPKASKGMDSAPVQRPELPRGALGSRSQSELIEVNEMVKSGEINVNEAQMFYSAWQQRYGRNNSSSFKDRKRELDVMKTEYMTEREKKGQKPSSGFFARLGLSKRPSKGTIKLNISEPVQSRNKEPSPTDRGSTDSIGSGIGHRQLSAVRDSNVSRGSAWSEGSRDSGFSMAHDPEADSEHRMSLGHQYLQAEATQTERVVSPPPPLPPRTHCPPISASKPKKGT
ncbi:phosphoinositide 3-kinase adapter protein 1-like isoform X2 [Littorina saxatilis]|uniref:phosphoinositide 3-kinase adapter protein 1-like isoform X2 n=1 Tax=Littorina saxatilis TaxID=31220 RepID=UPI0038B48DC1